MRPISRIMLAITFALCAGGAGAEQSWYPSKYGPEDTRGAVNNLDRSPAGVLRALALAKRGKVFPLGIPTAADTPVYPGRTYKVEAISSPPAGDNKLTSHDELVTSSLGIGTQIDGLAHIGIDDRFYNGIPGERLRTAAGVRTLDLVDLPPIITRGVLIDMARHFGKPMLEGREVFDRARIEAAMREQKLTIGKGDVVIFHTGWMKLATTDKARFLAGEPGLDEGGAEWLAGLGVVAIGADTGALEILPPADEKRMAVVHQTLLAKNGVHILENIDTAALAADGPGEFLFILGAPRFAGTVQLVINPIAIR